ncbi:hypothetical protein RIF29_19027 [Crotalaria pallida]|uniref:Uncharacterized protein n=1 Tax=Crotalaria pallida TaxID=3830 RepID=A0AAN9F2I5_CROPI
MDSLVSSPIRGSELIYSSSHPRLLKAQLLDPSPPPPPLLDPPLDAAAFPPRFRLVVVLGLVERGGGEWSSGGEKGRRNVEGRPLGRLKRRVDGVEQGLRMKRIKENLLDALPPPLLDPPPPHLLDPPPAVAAFPPSFRLVVAWRHIARDDKR